MTSPLAVVVNYLVVDFKWLNPNLITLFSFIVAILSSIFIVVGGTTNFVIAAVLINLSHVLDCMDGQMARYRGTSSLAGSFYDKLTDQLQVIIWFGAVGYAAYDQTQSVIPIFLVFIGVSFYSLRGYTKYVAIYTEMSRDNEYLEKTNAAGMNHADVAGLGHSLRDNFRWFIGEQKKIFLFDEGVFIFMLSFALVVDQLIPMLWVFAVSQLYHGLARCWQRGFRISHNLTKVMKK